MIQVCVIKSVGQKQTSFQIIKRTHDRVHLLKCSSNTRIPRRNVGIVYKVYLYLHMILIGMVMYCNGGCDAGGGLAGGGCS